ncbi:MAG: hypothetical protein JSS82_11060 [Bacteroidetes bacterium]|nr:hypothetical protein [Bacteroidota bacterium]
MAVWLLHFAYPLFYSAALFQRHQLQSATIAENSGNSFTEITLTASAFNKSYSPAEKELEIDGSMYDVAHVHRNGNLVTCYVLSDKDETTLKKSYNSELRNQHSAKNTSQVHCWWPVVMLYTSYQPITGYPVTDDLSFHDVYMVSLHEGHFDSRLQPPRLA